MDELKGRGVRVKGSERPYRGSRPSRRTRIGAHHPRLAAGAVQLDDAIDGFHWWNIDALEPTDGRGPLAVTR